MKGVKRSRDGEQFSKEPASFHRAKLLLDAGLPGLYVSAPPTSRSY